MRLILQIEGARKENVDDHLESVDGRLIFGRILDRGWRFVLKFKVAGKINKGEIA